jgi:hypothetical protein
VVDRGGDSCCSREAEQQRLDRDAGGEGRRHGKTATRRGDGTLPAGSTASSGRRRGAPTHGATTSPSRSTSARPQPRVDLLRTGRRRATTTEAVCS